MTLNYRELKPKKSDSFIVELYCPMDGRCITRIVTFHWLSRHNLIKSLDEHFAELGWQVKRCQWYGPAMDVPHIIRYEDL